MDGTFPIEPGCPNTTALRVEVSFFTFRCIDQIFDKDTKRTSDLREEKKENVEKLYKYLGEEFYISSNVVLI